MKKRNPALLVVAIIAVALVMRAPFTGVGSLIKMIQADLTLSSAASGMITTIPLLAFAIVSPLATRIAAAFGMGKTMVFGLLLSLCGIVLRSLAGTVGFFAGTALIGIGIAFSNVLVPSIIKASFPDRVGVLTSCYTTCMSAASGLAVALAVPLSTRGLSWQSVLMIWWVPVAITLLIWLSQWDYVTEAPKNDGNKKPGSLLRSPLTWSVSLFMGIQSMLFYSFVAWMPSILQAKGVSAEAAGYYASLYQWIAVPASITIPLLAGRMKNQRFLAAALAVTYALGLLLLLLPATGFVTVLCVVLMGLCSGGCLSMAIYLIGVRSGSARQTAALSGIAQCVGYAIASISPMLLGWIYDSFNTWSVPIAFLIAMAAVLFVMGLHAGQDRLIEE